MSLLDASQASVAVVRGPAGAGKTVLMASWARTVRNATGAWFTVEPSSTTRLAFWASLLDTLRDSGVAPRGTLLGDIVVGGNAEDLLAQLRRGFLAITRDEPLIIVLDDFHLITDTAIVDDLAGLVLQVAHLRLVIGTRELSEFEAPTLSARLGVTTISDLSFTRVELMKAVAAHKHSSEVADRLWDAFNGWPLPSIGVLSSIDSGLARDVDGGIALIHKTMSPEQLAPELVGTETFDFLMRTSLAPYLTLDLAARMGGRDARAQLQRVERAGLGSWASGRGTQLFRYQPAVRAIFNREALHTMSGELPALRAHIIDELDLIGDPLAAMQQCLGGEDWDRLARVLQHHYMLVHRLHQRELHEVLDRIPFAELTRRPLLAVEFARTASASADNTGASVQSLLESTLREAQTSLLHAEGFDRMWTLRAVLVAQRLTGRHAASTATSEALLREIDSLRARELQDIGGALSVFLEDAGHSMLIVGHDEEAVLLFERARKIHDSLNDPFGGMRATGLYRLALSLRGEHYALRDSLVTAHDRTRPIGWRGRHHSAGFHVAEALLALDRFDLATAREHARTVEREPSVASLWPVLTMVAGLADLLDGQAELGASRIAREVTARRGQPDISPAMFSRVALTRTQLLIAAGRPDTARRVARSAPRGQPRTMIAEAISALALGEAAHSLTLAGSVRESHANPRTRSEALLVEVVALTALGRHDSATGTLQYAMSLMRENDLRLPLALVPRVLLQPVIDAEYPGQLDGVPDAFPSFGIVEPLTARELLVLRELDVTASSAVIASKLFVSPNTVKSQLRSIYRKLGVTSRERALEVATRRGLITDHDFT